jgi:hypothetical protein
MATVSRSRTMTDQSRLMGGCACGNARFSVSGPPIRAGLCHCLTCRKAHAGAFNPFLVFTPDQVTVEGALATWESSPGYRRHFCGRCGSRVLAENFSQNGEAEYEISLGSFDDTGIFTPQYESWIARREPWLSPLNVPQFEGNRQGD